MESAYTKSKKVLRKKQRSFLRAKLLEKRRQLMVQLEAGLSRTADVQTDGMGGDLLDLAQDSEERNSAYQLAEMEATAVGAIDEAIDRIERGTYGVCDSCGKRIPAARLRAIPSASMCVPCKQALEADQSHDLSLPYERLRDTPDAMFDPESVYGSVRGRKVG